MSDQEEKKNEHKKRLLGRQGKEQFDKEESTTPIFSCAGYISVYDIRSFVTKQTRYTHDTT